MVFKYTFCFRMQTIDRLYRSLSVSKRRVLITFMALSGSFLALNYAFLSGRRSLLPQIKHPKPKPTFLQVSQHQNMETFGHSNDDRHEQKVTFEITNSVKGSNYHKEMKMPIKSLNKSRSYSTSTTTNIISTTRKSLSLSITLLHATTNNEFFNESNYGESTDTENDPERESPVVGEEITNNKTDYNNNTNNSYDYYYDEQFEPESVNTNNGTEFVNNVIIFSCKTNLMRRAQKRNKNLIVFENFIPASFIPKCHESITYTTHGDYRYLDNLIPLVTRWNGPISIAVYSPGEDLYRSLKIISYLRDCSYNGKIRNFVTFHLFFDARFEEAIPSESQFHWLDSIYQKERWTDCTTSPRQLRDEITFRMKKKLLYPVNIGRNIARSAATTHFVLASDIELYPNVNIIPAFFEMLHEASLSPSEHKISMTTTDIAAKQVFVLPVFEVRKGMKPPRNKNKLVSLLKTKEAIPFHNSICKECHLIPRFNEWNKITLTPKKLKVAYKAKRKPPFQFWEPIYIGTKYEPPYDERLSWEGLRDKMTQGYILCALDYDFLILDNAFLVHKPGIKRLSHNRITKTVLRQDRLINLKIKSELFKRFGKLEGCTL